MPRQTVIVPAQGGLLMLAERTEHGLQLSIENFLNWADAQDWCRRHKVRATFEVEGIPLADQTCSLLGLLASGDGRPLRDLSRELPGAVGRNAPSRSSIGAVRAMAARLEAAGLAVLGREGAKVGGWGLSLTERGHLLAAQIGPN